jgi:hypothetical protein
MKRRFAVTLLAVAIAVVGASAFARAPVIGAVRDPVIADDYPVTAAAPFVYPDAINLNPLAVDPEGAVTSGSIIWSYTGAGSHGASRYVINGCTPLDLTATVPDDPNNPLAKSIGANDTDPSSQDGNVRTITFRDAVLSPIGGTNSDPRPSETTSLTIASEVLTLFASDSSSYSYTNIIVYTEDKGRDRLSGSGMVSPPPVVPDPTTGWTSTSAGTVTMTSSPSGGVCIEVPAAGNNYALWKGPYPFAELVENNVYRFRLTMDPGTPTSSIPVDQTPFWDLVIDNYDENNTGGVGGANISANRYFGDYMNIDREGNANSVGQPSGVGLGTVDVWWCPSAINSASWNDPTAGEFTPAKAATKDIRLQFRVMDVVNSAFDGSADHGKICVHSITAERIPISQLVTNATRYPLSGSDGITTTTHNVSVLLGIVGIDTDPHTVVTWGAGTLTCQPYTAGAAGNHAWDTMIVGLEMGDTNYSTDAALTDNYPIPWQSNKLLKGTLGVEAPNAAGESYPPDAIEMLWDGPTNEVLYGSGMVSTSDTNGMPKAGVVTDYVSLFYTNHATLSLRTNVARLRMKVMALCNVAIRSGDSDYNTGGITFTKMRVEEVSLP